jgi:hypothetical protein
MPVASVNKKIDSALQKSVVRCLAAWDDDDLPWTEVKQQLVDFIRLNCKTKECICPPSDPREYMLSRESLKLMTVFHSGNASIVYMFDATSGCVAVGRRLHSDAEAYIKEEDLDSAFYAFLFFDNSPAPTLV